MSLADPSAFDIAGDLPGAGVTLLEASAGTGKTYTIAALVARYVAEGIPISEFLVITFTIAATSELRDRVRRRLEEAERGLDRYLATGQPDGDPLIAVLSAGDRGEVELRRQRLSHALANFDAATITTTHGFCLDALAGLGLAGDCELQPVFAPDVSDLVEQTLADEYLRLYRNDESPLPVGIARDIVRAVNGNPDARIEPIAEPDTDTDADTDSDVAGRVSLALAARSEIARRKRLGGLATFDDLVNRLNAAVSDPIRGAQAVATLQSRYRIVLVDEFQDTDNSQWAVLRTAFGSGSTTLLLIGDPKQAIYAFRGADIHAYLAASRAAEHQRTLTRNFRSDARLLDALDLLFGDAELGDPLIRYREVVPGDPSKIGNPSVAALQFRVLGADAPVRRTSDSESNPTKAAAGKYIARDLAAEVVARLEDGERPERIAVLVGKHADAKLIHDALAAAGVPVVIRSSVSVLQTDAARAWLWLLDALDRPSSAGGVRRLAATAFLGWSSSQIATASDSEWAALHRQVSEWADVPAAQGIAALFDTVARSTDLFARVLRVVDGERDITDLQHIAELVNGQSVATHAGAGALAAWLRERMAESLESDEDERARRLDSDAQAVQVLTVHAAKGLEFPIVYCPFLWHAPWNPQDPPAPVYHLDGERVIHVGGKQSSSYAAAESGAIEEDAGQSLRLAYVALTRAQHQLIVWWAGNYGSKPGPLSRILASSRVPGGGGPIAAMTALASASDTVSVVELAARPSRARWSVADSREMFNLSVNSLDRPIDWTWKRSSFTALTSAAHDARVGSEAGVWQKADEADRDVDILGALSDTGSPLREVSLPLALMPAGAAVGTFVHSVLEDVDFASADLLSELGAEVDKQLAWRKLARVDSAVVCEGLAAALSTPLGADIADVALTDISHSDRINEMGFEYGVAGGAVPSGAVSVAAIRSLLTMHLATDDPLLPYVTRLDDPELEQTFRGFMTGSLDLVFRTRSAGGDWQFSVADYKTNRLGPADELSAWHYRPDAVRDAVFEANYPLQFLIYSVALHRYLRWRLPGYDPAVNLGPVKYLFVRGMIGPSTPVVDGQRCGVYSWQPPAPLVCALSDLMAKGATA